MMFIIEMATIADVPEMARLHVMSWQTAFKGVVPESELRARDVGRSIEGWTTTYHSFPENLCVARESTSRNILGFCCAGPVVKQERSGPFGFEFYSLHVAPGFYHRGIGTAFLRAGFNRMRDLGLDGAIVWTLDQLVQARRFYEKHGGQVVKRDTCFIGGQKVGEVAYGWPEGLPS
jgi:ribosomal protein S18 acetylase RimI-like enzyme